MRVTKRTEENLSRAKLMKESGATHFEIGVEFGVCEATVRQWLYPEKYQKHKERAAAWTRAFLLANPTKSKEYREHRRLGMTREQLDVQNAKQRERYAADPRYKESLKRLRIKYQGTAQGRLSHKVRVAVLAFSGRFPNMFQSMMEAVNGMTRSKFMAKFQGEGVFDHIVPICAFDLTNPEHLVRCCYHKNVRLISRKENELKGSKWDKSDIMSLPWVGTQDALIQAQTFISRQLKRIKKEEPPQNGTKSKTCVVCGTETEQWVYDINQQVKCQGCAG